MSVSGIFKKTFGILRANPKIILPYLIVIAIIGISSVYFTLSLAGSVKGAGINTTAGFLSVAAVTIMGLLPLLALIAIVVIFVTPLIAGIYISIADQGYLKRAVSLGKAFGVAKANYLNMLLTSILVGIIWTVVFVVLAAVFALPASVIGGAGSILWLIIGVIVSIVALVLLTLYLFEAYALVILEKLGPISAVRRSVQIGRQKLGLLFKVLLLTILVTVVFIIVDVIAVLIFELPLVLSGHTLLGLGIGQTVNFLLISAFSAWIMMIPVAFYKEYVKKGKK